MPRIKHIIFAACIVVFPICAHAALSENSLFLGYKAYQGGRFDEAIKYLEAAKKDDPLLSDYSLYYLGESYLSLNRLDEAFNAFQACTNNNPKSPLKSSAMEKIGDIYLAKGDAIGAINIYKEILTGHSDNTQTPRILYKSISALLQNNKYDEALPFIKRLLTEFPQTEYNDSSFASQILSGEALKLNVDEFSARAKGLLRARNYEKAAVEIRSYLFDGPTWFPYDTPLKRNDELDLLFGQAFYQAKNYKKAGEIFKELFSTADYGKTRQESLIWLTRNYIRQKNIKSAKNVLKAFISAYSDKNLRDEAIYRLAMIAKDDGDADTAIAFLKQLIAENPASSYRDDALWQTGWMYYMQRNFEKSLDAWKSLENSALRMRSLYWQGKASLLLGRKDNAARLFKVAAAIQPPDYYSAMSKKELQKISGYEFQNVYFEVSDSEYEIQNPKPDEPLSIQRTRRLLELGLNDLALKELASVDYPHTKDFGVRINTILLYKQAGDFYHSYILARRLSSNLSGRLVYPEAYKEPVNKSAGKFQVDPLLIYAVMMQESEFDAGSVSSAGAIGLLQIMPGTGEMIAKKLPYLSFATDSLFEPDVNINFGTWYLKTLIARFDGNLPFAIAAYNAGPNAVDEWLKKWGAANIDEFVENIPYQETRKYVEKVLGYYEAYKAIYASDREDDIEKKVAKKQ